MVGEHTRRLGPTVLVGFAARGISCQRQQAGKQYHHTAGGRERQLIEDRVTDNGSAGSGKRRNVVNATSQHRARRRPHTSTTPLNRTITVSKHFSTYKMETGKTTTTRHGYQVLFVTYYTT